MAMLQDIDDGELDGEEISGVSDMSWSGESDSDSESGSDHEPSRKRINAAVQTAGVPNIIHHASDAR